MGSDKLYKVKHKESKLYWKGGGINSNNNSNSHILRIIDGIRTYEKINYGSEKDALDICFSRTGKTWSSLGAVKSALGYGHESGLNSLLKKCTIMEIELIEKEIER
jgi:hypothetical protein